MSVLFSVLELSFTRLLNKHITFVILILLWTFELLKWMASCVQIYIYTCIYMFYSERIFMRLFSSLRLIFLNLFAILCPAHNHKFMQCQFLVRQTYWREKGEVGRGVKSLNEFVYIFCSFRIFPFVLLFFGCITLRYVSLRIGHIFFRTFLLCFHSTHSVWYWHKKKYTHTKTIVSVFCTEVCIWPCNGWTIHKCFISI